MTSNTLPFPTPEKNRAPTLFHHLRADIWLRVWTGVRVAGQSVATSRNQERRERCRADLLQFLLEYMGERFFAPGQVHLDIVSDFQIAILSGAMMPIKQAEAAPRSIGKTTISEGATIWAALYHHKNFILFIGATAPKGKERVAGIKNELITNTQIREDFPEIVEPILEFGGDPRSAPPDYPWSADVVRLSNGVWIHGRGIDSSVAGVNFLGMRPDLTIIDDIETLDTLKSDTETKTLDERVRLEVLRLHDINKPAAYFFICTIRGRGGIANRMTNRLIEPEWRGRRYKALIKFPDQQDLWEPYMELCKPRGGMKPGQEQFTKSCDASRARGVEAESYAQFSDGVGAQFFSSIADVCRVLDLEPESFVQYTEGYQLALRYYVKHKQIMDAGATLLDARRLPLHVLYHALAEDALAFACELQNDPPEANNSTSLQLDVEYIMSRRVGDDRKVVPDWASRLTIQIDVGAHSLHWEADVWDADFLSNCLIDQGIQQTNLNAGGEFKMTDDDKARQVMVSRAVQDALTALRQQFSTGYYKRSGALLTPVAVAVDCGGTAEAWAWYEVVLRFCASSPRWLPLKGERWAQSIANRAQGRNWICEDKNNPGGKRHDCNADEYKKRLARAYEMPALDKDGRVNSGARILHRETPMVYAKHQTAEKWIETISSDAPVGKELKIGWNRDGTKPNHWWDTGWMGQALADILRSARGKAAPRRALPQQQQRNDDPSMG